jgi:hypothetical protein
VAIDATAPRLSWVIRPAEDAAAVTESGQPAADAPGVKFVRSADSCAVYEVGSGDHRFATAIAQP